MNINELNLVQKGPSWIETIFMQIKEVAARYKNLLILSSVITEVTSHYGDFKMHGIPWKYHWIYFNCFISSMDIVSITHELSKDYIENLRNSSYLKIGFIMVKIVCMSAEFNRNGEFKNFKASLYS